MKKNSNISLNDKSCSLQYEAIDDYAIIGDCHTAALVSRTGSMDWLCFPHFSGPSLFAALLDSNRGGRLLIRPRDIARIERRYKGRSAVLETIFQCANGAIALCDFMVMPAQEGIRKIIRGVECLEETVEIDVLYQPAPNYARKKSQLQVLSDSSWLIEIDDGSVIFEADMPLQLSDDNQRIEGHFQLTQGEFTSVALFYFEGKDRPSSSLERSQQLCQETIKWWNQWSDRCVYDGPYSDAVIRSCLTLKLLTHDTTGAIMAALTASLPETFKSGARNWDYRYCWLRDTSLLLQSFLGIGFKSESEKFFKWLLRAVRKPHLLPFYDLNAEVVNDEFELTHLEGYRGLGHVHIGNSAHNQLQLDIYGEIFVTAYSYVHAGGALDPDERKLLVSLGQAVQRLWREPDQGIWESRGPARHHTYSKVMCWVALDRLLALNKSVQLDIDEQSFADECAAIRREIELHGYDPELKSYVGYFGGKDADASLLLMLRYGYAKADDPRLLGTYRYIFKQLSVNGLLFRYPPHRNYDGISESENLFVVCNFWAVDFLARTGAVDEATQLFERLLGLANDVGLYAEQLKAESGEARGNFPQAFSQSGLITAALVLAEARSGHIST